MADLFNKKTWVTDETITADGKYLYDQLGMPYILGGQHTRPTR